VPSNSKRPALRDLGEELFGGRVKCRKCGRWCTSWAGLAVHFGKRHGKRLGEATWEDVVLREGD